MEVGWEDTVRQDAMREVGPLKHMHVWRENLHGPHCTNANRGESSSDFSAESCLATDCPCRQMWG